MLSYPFLWEIFLNQHVLCVSGAEVGPRVAVIGAGGIGFDVSDFLTHPVTHLNLL